MRVPVAVIVALVLGAAAAPVRADDAPWTVGVSAAQKASAQQLLDAGNALFLQHDYAAALGKYRAAVAQWDHPAIRFNMVRCLIQLGLDAEAADNLKLALRYGAAPLEDQVYSEALAYQKLLANQVGELDVRCAQAGVAITLDGQPLLACPGARARQLAPGHHQVVGTAPGMLTKAGDVIVIGGQHADVDVALVPLASAGRVVHRWASWKPWLVVGGGATLAAVGGLVEAQAAQEMSSYDRSLALVCADTGCGPSRPVPASVADEQTRARRDNGIAIGVISAGVATAALGGVLVYLNRGRIEYPTAARLARALEHVEIAPARGGAAFALHGRF